MDGQKDRQTAYGVTILVVVIVIVMIPSLCLPAPTVSRSGPGPPAARGLDPIHGGAPASSLRPGEGFYEFYLIDR